MLTSNAYPDKRKTKHEHFMQKRMSTLPCFDFLKQVIHHSLANATPSYLCLFMPFMFSLLSISNEINPSKTHYNPMQMQACFNRIWISNHTFDARYHPDLTQKHTQKKMR
jgi:hypothetical protein